MKKNIKYALSIVVLLALFISVGSIVMAEKSNKIVEPVVIEAEDIGIKVNENEIIEEEFINDDSESENKDMDVPVQDTETEEPEVETESPAPPEGKVEGYVAGEYLDPNENDCEVCEECYNCEDEGHIYARCVSVNEEGYIYEEWCVICGHGIESLITDEEFDALGVETDVEF